CYFPEAPPASTGPRWEGIRAGAAERSSRRRAGFQNCRRAAASSGSQSFRDCRDDNFQHQRRVGCRDAAAVSCLQPRRNAAIGSRLASGVFLMRQMIVLVALGVLGSGRALQAEDSGYLTSVGSGETQIPVVVVRGTPYEMGRRQGELIREGATQF